MEEEETEELKEEEKEEVSEKGVEVKQVGEDVRCEPEVTYLRCTRLQVTEAKAEEELGEMISGVPDSISKVDKAWDLHETYKWANWVRPWTQFQRRKLPYIE